MIKRLLTRYGALQQRLPERVQVSPVVALVVVFGLAVGWILILDGLGRYGAEQHARMSVLERQLVLAAREEPEPVWEGRLQAVTAQRDAVAERILWSGDTPGVVAARIQSAAAGLVQSSQVPRGQVRLSEAPVTLDGVSSYEVTIEGLFEPASTGALIDGLVEHSPTFRILAIEATVERPRTVRIVALAPVGVVP
jgi:hypothetical protein